MADVFVNESDRQKVEETILSALAAFEGVELVETKYYKEYGSFVLEILLWRAGGVDLNLCERAHGAVSDALDGIDELFKSPYMLKVSSMGLDRPIVNDDDLRRALGTEIEFKNGDGKRVNGMLCAYDQDSVTLKIKSVEKTFQRKFITKVQPYIRF